MKLRYLGTGTVVVEGAGEVSEGQVLEVPEGTARALLEERPEHWKKADGGDAGDGAAEVPDQPRTRRGR